MILPELLYLNRLMKAEGKGFVPLVFRKFLRPQRFARSPFLAGLYRSLVAAGHSRLLPVAEVANLDKTWTNSAAFSAAGTAS